MSRRLTAAAAILGLSAALAACATGGASRKALLGDQPPAPTPTEQYSIRVSTAPEQIAIGLHAEGLSPNQQAALSQFATGWREDGGGPITVSAPTDGADPQLARGMADAIGAYLGSVGVPAERLQIAGYAAKGARDAPVLASYDRYVATGPSDCAHRWDSQLGHADNVSSAHFGCAVVADMAAQIANPRDLLAPAAVTPSDGSRRQVVLDKYRQGQVTSSAQDQQASGKVSDSGSGQQ